MRVRAQPCRVCSTWRCERIRETRMRQACGIVCVWMQEATGCASLGVTARLFCSLIGADKEPVTLLLWLVKSGDSTSLLTMTLHG